MSVWGKRRNENAEMQMRQKTARPIKQDASIMQMLCRGFVVKPKKVA